MINAAHTFSALLVAFAAAAAFPAFGEQPPPPPTSSTVPAADDVPPFLHARSLGSDGLNFAVSGIARGYALVSPGRRFFGLCWQGGSGPFALRLLGPGGVTLLYETSIGGQQFSAVNHAIEFAPGVYRVLLTDSQGHSAAGQFTVADFSIVLAPPPPSSVAAGADPELGRATILSQTDLRFSYEAYLSVLARATGDPQSDPGLLASRLCHRHD